MHRANIYAVIMAGGTGTRFWPLSRERFPKQFLRLFAPESMIEQTIARLSPLIAPQNTYIVTTPQYAEDIRLQLPYIKERIGERFIIEPMGKNTAPALGLSAIYLKDLAPEPVMISLPADHVIRDKAGFLSILQKAITTSLNDRLVTIGITPTRPETGYGYIKFKDRWKEDAGVYEVERFVEKPSIALAKRYLKTGKYLWNSGIFIWKVSVFLEELKRCMPDLYKGLMAFDKVRGSKDEKDVLFDVYNSIKPQSVDYGVMERSHRVVVIPADIGWNDVGTWKAIDDLMDKDPSGNIIEGNVINIDSNNSIIYGGKRLIASVGIKDTIVVDTEDATLVCAKDRAQDVRRVVEELKNRNSEEYLIHRTVHRPWGSYTVLEKGDLFKIKRIVVEPGARLSMQRHRHRSEHWVVVSGTALVTVDGKALTIKANESTFIPSMALHRLENPHDTPLHIIEVQCGGYLEEDDIERFDDDYGRETDDL